MNRLAVFVIGAFMGFGLGVLLTVLYCLARIR